MLRVIEQPLGELEDQRGRPHIAQMVKAHVHAFANDAGVSRDRRADDVWAQYQGAVIVKVCGQTFFGRLYAISLDARKSDFQGVALGAHRLDLDSLAWRLRWGDDGLGGEVEGDAKNISILDIEEPFVRAVFVQLVGLATQRTSNDLLAQELGAEGASARP